MATSPEVVLRQLGKLGPLVPRLGVGLMNLSGVYSVPGPDAERFKFLDAAYEMGERFWDTGKLYDYRQALKQIKTDLSSR